MGKKKKHHRCDDCDSREKERAARRARNDLRTVCKTVSFLVILARPDVVQQYSEFIAQMSS